MTPEYQSSMARLGRWELLGVLCDAYELTAPREKGDVVVPEECAEWTDAKLNQWDHDNRFLARRIARCIVALKNHAP